MKHLIIFTMFLAVLTGCSKKVKELAPPTDTGANSFGASVNGKLWAPQGFGIAPTASILEANFAGNNSYKINARNFGSSPTETEFEIVLVNITGPGSYELNNNTPVYPNHTATYASYTLRRFYPESIWVTSSQTTGKVIVTRLDTVNKVISGTFEFTANDSYGSGAPLSVKDGRFDVKIN